ncbi:AAA domain protein [Synechococcus sp. RS9909]|uniref:AAA family ATPase n=1 Tax=unclassified Synechococcus TaxID=2626047 RepID=UPI000068F873|nr:MULTISPECIES: AAA family ATPase [unclassified Synechococcus]EAQ69383.1 RecF protein:ABC transporter [Synechococcus sp. RS9917]QNI79361.1 AAA domain protein [Synechococcus sp. RS9909]
MRLTHCRLESVRRHRQLELVFAPGVTLVAGANESGKSTLVEAMHRALFLRANATGAPIQALRSQQHPGHPQVEIGFEAANRAWTLQKRFSGASGTASLRTAGQDVLQGGEAEDRLAQLLSVPESLGSRQVNRQLPGRWAHLWVMQGEAGRDLLAQGAEHYALAALIEALEAKAEGALQSPLDQRVNDQLESLVQAAFTSRGVRTNSVLWQCQQTSAAAREGLETAIETRERFEQSGEALDQLVQQIDTIERQQLPALQGRIRSQKQRISLLQSLEPLRLRREPLERQRGSLQRLETEARSQAERQVQLDLALERLQQENDQAVQTCRQQRTDLQALEQQRQALEQRGQTLRRLEERAGLEQRCRELEIRRTTVQALQRQRQQLQEKLRRCRSLSAAEHEALQEQRQALEALRIRREAMATRVRLLRASSPVALGGAALQVGEERLLSQPFGLTVGEGVELELTPGGGADLEALERECQQRRQQLEQMLQRHDFASVEEAEAQWQQRLRLDAEQRLLEGQWQQVAPAEDLETELQTLRQRLAALQEEETAVSSGQPVLDDQLEQLAQQPDALHRALEQCRISYRTVQESWKRLQGQRDPAEARLAQTAKDLQSHQLQRERLLTEQASGLKQRQTLVEECGDLAQLDAALEALRREEDALRRSAQDLPAEAGGVEAVREAEAELQRLEAEEQRLARSLQQLSAERGGLQERCLALSDADPYAAEEEAAARLEQAEARERSERLVVEAQQLLLHEFQRARSDLSSRYTVPLRRSMDRVLAPLFGPDGARTALGYSAKDGLGDLGLERDGLLLPFAALSGGLREQLNAALRLAIADVLRVGHDGCLPVLFDDAFSNSDPQRLQAVLTMLRQAADRGLQVIVMSCDPDPYRAIADAVVELPTS